MKQSPVQLGTDMWHMLSSSFHQTAEANNLTTLQDKAQLWAGFMAAAAGHMTGDIGGKNTHAVLFTVAESCAALDDAPEAVKQRPNLKVVKP